MASDPRRADKPISQEPVQLAVQTAHIPEKLETWSGIPFWC